MEATMERDTHLNNLIEFTTRIKYNEKILKIKMCEEFFKKQNVFNLSKF